MPETPPNHPTAEELRALSLGQLPDAELARVSAHLGGGHTWFDGPDRGMLLATIDRELQYLVKAVKLLRE